MNGKAPTVSPWTEERTELLKKRWADGASASQIAAELGLQSRNQVIGKVHRLGLSERDQTLLVPAQRRSRRRRSQEGFNPSLVAPGRTSARPPRPTEAIMDTAKELVIPVHQRCTILELTDERCHWPIGDVQAPDFYFCGAKIASGWIYCGHHARMAYLPAKSRSRAA